MAIAIDQQSVRFKYSYAMLAALLGVTLLLFLWPVYAFSVDESIYVEMARAMAERGSLSLTPANAVEAAAPLERTFTHVVNGQVMPQYPSGYALIAAPFYLLLGARGLVLMNLLASFAAAAFTYKTGRHLFDDARIAAYGTGLLVLGTFFSTYVLGIWPHMVSLALLLWAAERLAFAATAPRGQDLRAYISSGLILGVALTIRVDIILAILAGLIWIRLFAAPSRRIVGLSFCAGLLPGLVLASTLNFAKFGIPSPIAYGPAGEDDLMARYTLQMIAVGAGLVPLMLLDFASAPFRWAASKLRERSVLLGLGGLAILSIALVAPLRTVVWNMVVLLGDLQLMSVEKADEPRTVAGSFFSFWGLYKVALLQSVPVLVLAGLSFAALLKIESTRSVTLCLGMIAGPLLFYSLTQWHGGFGLNMRYFLPALPFACLLAAYGFCKLETEGRLDRAALLTSGKIGLGVFVLGALLLNNGLARIVFCYYLPLLLAGVLIIALIMAYRRSSHRSSSIALSSVLGASLAFGAAASAEDLIRLQQRLSYHASLSEPYAAALPQDGLVLASIEELMATASMRGTHVAVQPETPEAIVALTAAYNTVGRCVFIHSSEDVVAILEAAGLPATRVTTSESPRFMLGLYRLGDPQTSCPDQ